MRRRGGEVLRRRPRGWPRRSVVVVLPALLVLPRLGLRVSGDLHLAARKIASREDVLYRRGQDEKGGAQRVVKRRASKEASWRFLPTAPCVALPSAVSGSGGGGDAGERGFNPFSGPPLDGQPQPQALILGGIRESRQFWKFWKPCICWNFLKCCKFGECWEFGEFG